MSARYIEIEITGESRRFRFMETALNPYSADGGKMDIYEDDRHELWIRPGKVALADLIQLAPSASKPMTAIHVPMELRLLQGQLREKALQTAELLAPGFRERMTGLRPLEANDRREVYYFRWEDLSEPLSETELPPFVQVGLFPDGSVSSFTNTLS